MKRLEPTEAETAMRLLRGKAAHTTQEDDNFSNADKTAFRRVADFLDEVLMEQSKV